MTLKHNHVEGIYNMMESIVWNNLEQITQTEQNICLCSLCKLDITAYALNRLPAYYVSTQEGETRVDTFEMSEMVKEIVIEAMNHVSQHRHREHRRMTEHTMDELLS